MFLSVHQIIYLYNRMSPHDLIVGRESGFLTSVSSTTLLSDLEQLDIFHCSALSFSRIKLMIY